jgi:hypothetical protein
MELSGFDQSEAEASGYRNVKCRSFRKHHLIRGGGVSFGGTSPPNDQQEAAVFLQLLSSASLLDAGRLDSNIFLNPIA